MPSLAALSSFLSAALRRQGPRLLLPLLALALPSLRAATSGNFEYTDTGTAITITGITGYSGGGKEFVIPSTIAGKPVTAIGDRAFYDLYYVLSVTIPDSVTSIGPYAFYGCRGLTSIKVSVTNPAYASVDGVLFNKALSTLLQYPAVKTQSSYSIPDGVTSVGDRAFYDCYYVFSVTIPDSVTSIGTYAFYGCRGLTGINVAGTNSAFASVDGVLFNKTLETLILHPSSRTQTSFAIPASVTAIEDSAFQNCFYLTSITIPSSVTRIEGLAFNNCMSLTSIDVAMANSAYTSVDGVLFTKALTSLLRFPQGKTQTSFEVANGVSAIGGSAFAGCFRLTSITIPAGVTAIGDSAFEYCGSLTTITLPNSVTSIGDSAFRGCNGLTNITISNAITTLGDRAFEDCSGLTSITIPVGVTTIGDSSFRNCNALTNFTIPNAVTSIGRKAFEGCTRLTSMSVPNSVTFIAGGAFAGCRSLTSITIPDTVTSIGNSTFNDCGSLTSITIPNRVTSIGDWAFSGCGLSSITIPNSVTAIGDRAFATCYRLTSITIPSSVTSIGSGAFYHCYRLTSITIPDSVTSIGNNAFEACNALTGIAIPNSVTAIGKSTFFRCGALASVTIPASVTVIGDYAFMDSGLTSVTIPGSVTSIGDSAFEYCGRLTSITIPESVTSIGASAFSRCSGLTSITIPASLTAIAGGTFSGCGGLTSITIPDSVASIGGMGFLGCSGLINVTIPNNVTSIGASAFSRCSGMTRITIPDSVTSIGASALEECSSLTGITIPSSVTSIPYATFSGCSGLTTITIPNSITSIGNNAFERCSALPRITIPDSVTSIGFGAFSNCSSLTSITIPDSITTIGYSAFEVCSSLTSITFPASVTAIPDRAFYDCSNLTSITIPASVTSIGSFAFYDCSALTSAYFEGDAPSTFNTEVFAGTAPAFTILYRYGATGFTSPTWKGYKAQALPVIATQPQSQSVVAGTPTTLFVGAAGTDLTYQWFKGGAVVTGATASTLDFPRFNSADAGLYDAVVTGTGGETLSRPIVVGVVPAAGERTAGAVATRPEWQGIRHPATGNVYDQFLLTGPAGTFTAAAGKIARMSYLDSNDSIVQVEMSGAGAITVVLDNATGPMDPSLYNQAGIQYMKGKATIILAGADATSHFTIYSVGTATNPGVTRAGTAYNGWADVAAAGISSTDGKLGGIHQGNVSYNAALGYTGIYAPTVTAVGGLVVVHGIAASADAIPYLYFATGGLVKVKIAGTALAQPNTDSLIVGGLAEVRMGAGQDSCGRAAPAAAIATRLLDDAENDRTTALVVGP
ncbi:MAG: leucine-rich repeat domain-containing protein [Opitutaceae bacterium]|nr:leucine-rich repeat domain-containing protein [Opitutaceae bacterium]